MGEVIFGTYYMKLITSYGCLWTKQVNEVISNLNNNLNLQKIIENGGSGGGSNIFWILKTLPFVTIYAVVLFYENYIQFQGLIGNETEVSDR